MSGTAWGSRPPWDRGSRTGLPSVSVVVPTHNRPRLLLRAVESVLRQDYPGEIECVVVYDKAVPQPLPIAMPANRSMRIAANDRTPGLAGARNAGTLVATGELLGFLDDDDEWLPAKVRLQVELMRRQRTHVVTCGVLICRGGRRIARAAKPRVTYRDLLRSRHMEVNPCTVLIERSRVLTDVGLVDEAIPGSHGEDYDWALRVARTADIIAVPAPLVRINWHGASYFARHWEIIAAANRYILEKHPDLASEPAGLARISGQISFALAASGQAAGARRWARRTLILDPRQPRAYLAILVTAGVLRADTMLRLANTFGRGI
jgi:glycosyltransferase involved in cell wall biosynthesis